MKTPIKLIKDIQGPSLQEQEIEATITDHIDDVIADFHNQKVRSYQILSNDGYTKYEFDGIITSTNLDIELCPKRKTLSITIQPISPATIDGFKKGSQLD